jgi:hypothetical protein
MSVLTKKERDGLEEVFLSINNSNTLTKKIKKYFFIFINFSNLNDTKKSLKYAKTGKFKDIFSLFLQKFNKVKKNLSK